MKKLLLAILLALAPIQASAQALTPSCSNPPPNFGVVWTPGQWITCLSSFQAYLGYVPLNVAGGTMTGELFLQQSSTTNAPLNMPPGVAPTAPVNGDVWFTSAGMYYRAGGVTYGPSGLLTVGSTPIASGTTTRVLYDNAGVLGEYAITGTGSVALSNSPSFVTPNLGAASATSLGMSGTITGADGGTWTSTGLITEASGTGHAGFNIPAGTAPTSPVNGDVWTTTTGMFVRINGATVGPLISAGSTAIISWNDTAQTSNFGASANTGYCVSTSGGAVSVQLPTAPAPGTLIELDDCDQSFSVNNMTILRGGSDKIMGTAGNVLDNITNFNITLRYNASKTNWIIIS